MNKLTKRIMALMLSLVMLLGCIPSFTNVVNAEGINITNKSGLVNKNVNHGYISFENYENYVTITVNPNDGYKLKNIYSIYKDQTKTEDQPVKQTDVTYILRTDEMSRDVDVYAEFELEPSEWGKLNSAMSEDNAEGAEGVFTVNESNSTRTIVLLKDITATSEDKALKVTNTTTKIILDLNGHILNRGLVNKEDGTIAYHNKGSVIEVLGGDLTIIDNDQNVEHKGNIVDGLWVPAEDGDTIIKGGIITGGTGNFSQTDIYRGGGIYVDYENTQETEKKAGSLVLEKGTICGNAGVGGGIFVVNSSFTMNDGQISYNKNGNTENVTINPAGINIDANGTFIMNGGEVSYNTATGSKSVGGIYPGTNTTINGGKIISNSSENNAGGIFNADRTYKFTISGKVIIKDNSCSAKNKDDIPKQQNLSTYFPINIKKLEDDSEIYITFGYNDHTKGTLTSGFQTNNPGAYYGDFFTYDGPEKFYMTLNAAGELEIKEKQADKYLIKILKAENGTALADKTEAAKDEEVTLSANPKSGYMLDEFIVTDKDSNPITVEDGKFTMPEGDVTITATFKEAPKSSGTKKYKADDKDTAEKITGSGKKGSTRTINPIEGKKVASVIVTDKDGNKIDVTMNEDGTYSFIQPASNVDVQVTYKNREITLNIGSTEAEVDNEKTNLDVCPVIRNDRTMLPIRFVAENLGAKVEWDETSPNIVTITRGDIEIVIHLGSDKAYVNGKEYKLDSGAFAENDRTYLPVRFVSENLNAIVEWNEAKPMEVKIYER